MPTKGLDQVRRNLSNTVGKITGPMTERTITEVLIIAAGYAATSTPVDTSNLINSQYRRLEKTATGFQGMLGYTAAYALFVHEAKGTLLGQNALRDPSNPGRGYVWAPNGKPNFLKDAFEKDGRADIQAAIKRGMKL